MNIIDQLLKFIIDNRSKKPNKNTIKMFEDYINSCLQENISIKQIVDEFKSGLTVDVFESQVKDYLK